MGGAEYNPDQVDGLYGRFIHNIKPWKQKIDIFRGFSSDALKTPQILSQRFSFIYIDAGEYK